VELYLHFPISYVIKPRDNLTLLHVWYQNLNKSVICICVYKHIKIMVFWDVVLCDILNMHQCLEELAAFIFSIE